MLDVSNLTVSYGEVEAVKGVSFTVGRGQTVAMIGANGAGKSSIMRCISGLVPAKGGEIRCEGALVTGRPAASIARNGIMQVPEGRQIFPNLTVAENLRLGGFWLSF